MGGNTPLKGDSFLTGSFLVSIGHG